MTAPLIIHQFGGLADAPHHPIATLPTPVERMAAVSHDLGFDVWVKRDDQTSEVYGGNKVRKLEWVLGEAITDGHDCIVTMGALGSHHVLACAVHGAPAGLDVHAVLVPQPLTDHVIAQLRAMEAVGTHVMPAKGYPQAAVAVSRLIARLRREGRKPLLIGPGASSPTGVIGMVQAGLELAQQVDAGELPEPERIYVAAGSGGTAAGIAIGVAASGMSSGVVAVRTGTAVTLQPAVLARLIRRTIAKIRALDPRFPPVAPRTPQLITVDPTQRGPGYGHSTPAAERALEIAARDGLHLDITYTAKALASLMTHAVRGPVLYWHTLAGPDQIAALTTEAPDLPSWAPALAARA